MLIDLADRVGVPFAVISDETKAAISARLDPGLEAANPLDAWGTGADFVPHFTQCLGDLLSDPEAALGLFSADIRDSYYLHRGFADAALAAAGGSNKLVAVATNYTQVRHDRLALELTLAGVPVLDGTANALAAVRGAFAYRDFLARPDRPAAVRPAPAIARLSACGWPPRLLARSTRRRVWLCCKPGASRRSRTSSSRTRRRRGARGATLGFPLVCKTAEGALHKSDVGGVRLGFADEQSLLAAYRDMAGRLGPRAVIAPMVAARRRTMRSA